MGLATPLIGADSLCSGARYAAEKTLATFNLEMLGLE